MGRLSDLHVELGEEGFQEGGWRLWFESRDRPKRPLQFPPRQNIPVEPEKLSHGRRNDFGAVAEAVTVLGNEGVNSANDPIFQGDAGPAALSHSTPERVAQLDTLPLKVRWCSRKVYASGDSSGLAAQAEGSKSTMPSHSLPVASSSSARLEPYTDEATKATTASRSAVTQRAAGSNSPDGRLQYGECRHCPRVFLMPAGDVLPYHHNPLVSERGPHPICPGSREAPGSHLEA
jgi:hypothetical protein